MTVGRVRARQRREYLDWLRGIAVLLMIEAHLLESWTGEPDRETDPYRNAMIVGGMGTALFLLLAGVAVGLSAGSKFRRSGDASAAATAVAKRGLEIFALAFLFRLQAWILGWSSNIRDLLQVDVLNVMGPSIVFAALLWRAYGSVRARAILFALAALATALLTPVVRGMSLSFLPDAIKGYIVPVAGLGNFAFFPWTALVFAGACLGMLIDSTSTPALERRVNLRIGIGGGALAAFAFAASFLPSPFEHSDFWTTSLSYLLIRVGVIMGLIAIAYGWTNATTSTGRWSPMIQLGRTSLFIYWIHVEMIYGLISRPFHHALSLRQVSAAYVLFALFMLACSVAKERVVEWYRLGRGGLEASV